MMFCCDWQYTEGWHKIKKKNPDFYWLFMTKMENSYDPNRSQSVDKSVCNTWSKERGEGVRIFKFNLEDFLDKFTNFV